MDLATQPKARPPWHVMQFGELTLTTTDSNSSSPLAVCNDYSTELLTAAR
jgi:hypothetical protein